MGHCHAERSQNKIVDLHLTVLLDLEVLQGVYAMCVSSRGSVAFAG